MIHLGDITKINGYEVPIVDCVIGGSPCQDLSVAGKRAGLAGERSGLYIEQIRLIKEMREQDVRRNNGRADRPVRPRYMVWENVPGAFSSNKGKDFAAVLEEAIRIAEPEAPDLPVPPKGWSTAGSIVGDGWSVAWRTHDAQYWGVPQRRKRISLVADFGGRTAPEILFECKSLSRNTEPGGEERERPSEGTEGSVRNSSGFDGNMGAKAGNIGYAQEQSPTLNAGKIMNVISFEPGIMSRDGGHCYEDVCGTLRANMGDNQFAVCGMDGYNGALTGDISSTLGVNCGMTTGRNGVMCLNDQGGSVMGVSEDVAGALRAQEHGHQPTVYCLQGNGIDRADTAGCNGKGWRTDQCYTLNTIDRPAVAYSFDSLASNSMKSKNPNSGCRKIEIAKTLDCFDPNPSKNQGGVAVLQTFDARGNGDGKTVCTITDDHENRVTDYTALCIGNGQADQLGLHEKVGALNCMHDQQAVICADVGFFNAYEQLAPSQLARQYKDPPIVNTQTVRKLTPLECERLQGFPDGWTDIGEWIDSKGKKHDSSDSLRYKALGNSIALPFWRFLCKRISAQYARKATMASLFDGIGGFPLVWEEWNGKGSAVWASEIEEFPIAVTKYHFGEE